MDGKQKTVDNRGKAGKRRMPKVRVNKFTVPKVKVEKQAFDRILGKLIQSGPQSEKRLK